MITITLLSYYDVRADVCRMLQLLSHRGRAYCVSKVDALKTFLVAAPNGWRIFNAHTKLVFSTITRERRME